ncbi:hypothetical protein SNOG_06566 [Parastagonospora nodorum SN15]|uniref:Uncharacterized protein n=1 Tax=Phaeosphaeria nodorum (strain SN15 / ATCC MYA-4574 / FGSC 10173) TaxID=321614 RepID=Q0UNU8_PHANO|nr:hypothetical protein SNOG_06566 [Parastagonospora nodorum SN15]EAT86397.1 hypothetical protein SNOG_06566 [Parastagonospora nodorum SN15]
MSVILWAGDVGAEAGSRSWYRVVGALPAHGRRLVTREWERA